MNHYQIGVSWQTELCRYYTSIFLKNPLDKANYRPVSVLSPISKIYVKLLQKQINNYIGSILSPYLCGSVIVKVIGKVIVPSML